MFEGSQHAPKGRFDDLLERAGGTNNGTTWLDRTNYYEVVPTHAVELALWLERDRMAHFLPVLDTEMLETQRGVVINERRQSYENRPYGMADERLARMLFPAEHPYSWPTIGFMPDLEAISLDDARSFYAEHYTPGNAVLVFAGDLAAEDAFTLAERYFGDLPAGPARAVPVEQAVDTARVPVAEPVTARGTMDDEVSFPRIYQSWSVPAYGTRDWVALDVLAYVLADGESSRLQRALVREGRLAQDADTWLYPTERCGIFGIAATARTGVTAEALEETVRAEIDRVAREGVGEEELAGAIRRLRRDQLAELATVEDRADALAYAATVLGEAEAMNEVLEAYATVGTDEVARVAAEWLAPGRGATLAVLPREQEETDNAA
jgi:zinc protease